MLLVDEAFSESEFYTSTITDTEFLVKPYRAGDIQAISAYWEFLSSRDVLKCFITEDVAVNATKIRAKYKGIKTADSLQIASAICSECDIFLTNDKQLRQVEEIRVLLVDEL